MVEEITDLILVFNFIVLIGLIAGMRFWQKKHGKLAEKKLALILTGYFSFSAITTTLPLLKINVQVTIVVDIVFLLVFWCVGYPWIRWLYRQFTSPK
jgi:hypothetical protein